MRFEQLSEKAKQRAISNHRNDHTDQNDWWQDCVQYAIEPAAEILGIEFNNRAGPGSSFLYPSVYFKLYSQSAGASFDGSYAFNPIARLMIRAEFPEDKDLHEIADKLHAEQELVDFKATAIVRAHSGSSCHEYATNIEVAADIFSDHTGDYLWDQVQEQIATVLRQFMRWMHRKLESEHDWLTSDKGIAEYLMANINEFTEDGEDL